MNPNAPSFSFSGGAPAFVPGQVRLPPRQPPQQQQQQQAAPSQPVQGDWDSEEPAAPAPTPAAAVRPPPSGGNTMSPGAVEKPKTISIGGGAPKLPAATSNATTNGPASTISLNIGGAASPAPASSQSSAAPAASSSPARAATPTGSAAAAAAATPSSLSRAATPTNASASSSSAKKASSISVGPPAAKVEKTADDVAKHVEAVADEDTLKDLYGNNDKDLVDAKEHINVVFIGHVDAGKSTMGGQILVQCGMVDKRTLEKFEKEAKDAGRESWYLSWALDSTPQERAKGKTVEVGRAYFETPKRRYTILDAPGHKSFVPSMISGAAQADVAILVISARKGEFETGFEKGGQTREHIVLVKTAGVQKLIIAVNKMDEPTVQWSKERYDEIVNKLTPFLKGTGFNPKTEVTFIPVSGFTGVNIKDKVSKKECSWYDGPSLLDLFDNMPMTDRKINAPLMMPISEKYKDMGTVVVGKIESGRARRGDQVMLMPNKNLVEITAIYSENEEEVPSAICGDNVRFRLKGIDDEDINVGFVVSDVRKPVKAVQTFEAQLAILDHKNIICAGYGAVMHVHTAAEEVTLSALLHYYDKKTGRKSRRPPPFAKKGQKIVALVEASAAVCIEKFDDYPQLGRFTLRDEGKTIAIGKVTKLIEKTDDLPNVAGLTLGAPSGSSTTNLAAA